MMTLPSSPPSETTSRHTITALDFDGVICDSASECLATAYHAYAIARGLPTADESPDALAAWEAPYRLLRPFLRHGRDNFFFLYFTEHRLRPRTQEEFDALVELHTADVCEALRVADPPELEALFQDTRRQRRGAAPEAWMASNPLYEPVADALRHCQSQEHVFITTSKPSDAVEMLLDFHRVPFPSDHILGMDRVSPHDGKNGHLEEVSRRTATPIASLHLLDDQVAHLLSAQSIGAHCYLAGWGYNNDQQQAHGRRCGIPALRAAHFPEWLAERCR